MDPKAQEADALTHHLPPQSPSVIRNVEVTFKPQVQVLPTGLTLYFTLPTDSMLFVFLAWLHTTPF